MKKSIFKSIALILALLSIGAFILTIAEGRTPECEDLRFFLAKIIFILIATVCFFFAFIFNSLAELLEQKEASEKVARKAEREKKLKEETSWLDLL